MNPNPDFRRLTYMPRGFFAVRRLSLIRRGGGVFLLLCDTVYKAQAVGSADAGNVVPARTGCEGGVSAKGNHELARREGTVVESAEVRGRVSKRRGQSIGRDGTAIDHAGYIVGRTFES